MNEQIKTAFEAWVLGYGLSPNHKDFLEKQQLLENKEVLLLAKAAYSAGAIEQAHRVNYALRFSERV